MSGWKDPFKRGVQSFRRGNYEEAVASFSKALELGGDDCTICDARAAVYEKIGKVKEALRDCKTVIDLQPTRWQGYLRSARLFLQIRKYDAASRMVDLALERIPSEQSARRDEMIALRVMITTARDNAAVEAARLASLRAYHFGKVPVEIAHTIFSMTLADDHAYVITLAQVCKNWRVAVLGTPSFWNTLVLTDKHPNRKIGIWKKRSKNRIRELALLADFSSAPAVLEELSFLSMRSLEVLRLQKIALHALRGHLPLAIANAVADVLDGWPSRTPISLGGELHSGDDGLVFRCRTLDLQECDTEWVRWGLLSENLQHLQSCSLTGCLRDSDWHNLLGLLHQNSALETLSIVLFHPRTFEVPDGRDIPPAITLPTMTSLELSSTNSVPDHLLPRLVLPSLRTLEIVSCRQPLTTSLQHLANGTASTLTTLSIQRAGFEPQLLLRALAAATALESLLLVVIANNAANVVLEGLANPPAPTGEDATATPLRVYCPSLRHLDCSNNPDIKGGPLVRLVKLRLTEAEASSVPSGEGEDTNVMFAQPIQTLLSLVIDGCPLVDPDILPWLRQKVPHVSAVYMTKKAAAWKR
ncbi:hypothetical protein C8Q74DRAFT_1214789 [Fomes fomentarius]|nr:hypothetical protein C8Q74DRAFT_1214789 [Fomes fomentarius]